MTNEQVIERARLVRLFLDSDEFKSAWAAVEDELVRDFRGAGSPEQAIAVYEEMKAMRRLMGRWKSYESNASVARQEIQERTRKRSWFS